jgi:dipeptidyl aminopeptidase/acylaminoacyl peptidase
LTGKASLPCGTWPSPLTAELVAGASIRLSEPRLDGEALYWLETRPAQQGRTTLLRRSPDGRMTEIVPAPFSVRNRVHEYGGGAFAVQAGVLVFANDADQRLYRLDVGDAGPTQPLAITPADGTRYGDLTLHQSGNRLLCVVERARAGTEPENFLASVDLASGEVHALARGADFYACPRLAPDGTHLAYLSWDHPAMPWDACRLHLVRLGSDGAPVEATATVVAGQVDEAIFQPTWSPAGRLHFISDRAGFSNLYRVAADGAITCVCTLAADFAAPPWVLGLSTYAFLDETTVLCSYQRAGLWHLATLRVDEGRLDTLDTPLTQTSYVVAGGGHAVVVAGSPDEELGLHGFDPATRALSLIHRPSAHALVAEDLAYPQPLAFTSAGNATAHALLYPPSSARYQAREGERPPLIVICHGGPTGSASTALNPGIQFWTSRGFAVLDVNYRGSTGYGRAYRKALDGQWGVVDVEDCVAGARTLAERGIVDGKRMAIRGSSAGGFTVLCALAFHDVFAAGASHYGVSDLEALAKDTHKFESRYLDTLVGPYPERRDLYLARSPLFAAARIACPVIFFQGQDDRVVPPDQTERMTSALRARGLLAPMLLFPGEQHGFRRKETITAALEAELDFYREVFAITVE